MAGSGGSRSGSRGPRDLRRFGRRGRARQAGGGDTGPVVEPAVFVAIGAGLFAGFVMTQTLALFITSASWRRWPGPGPAAGWLLAVLLSGAVAGALAFGGGGRPRAVRAAAVGGGVHVVAALVLIAAGAAFSVPDTLADALLLLAGAVGTAVVLLAFPLRPLCWLVPVYLLLAIEALPTAVDFWAVCLWATLAGIARRRTIGIRWS